MGVERQDGRDIGRRNLKILSKLLHFITFFFRLLDKTFARRPLGILLLIAYVGNFAKKLVHRARNELEN